MNLTVKPDPKRPSGGYAVLEGDIPGEEAWVAVFNTFSERFLGQHGWQSARIEFGPYPVERSGGGSAIVIGPEIVNHIEEYAVLRLQIGTLAATVNWPDTIQDRPGAAMIGGIRAVEGKPGAAPRQRVVVYDESLPEERPLHDEAVEEDVAQGGGEGEEIDLVQAETPIEAPKKRRVWPWLLLLFLILAAAAIAVWFFLLQPRPAEEAAAETAPIEEELVPAEPATEQPSAPEAAVVPPPEPVAMDNCASESLRALAGQPFAGALETVISCGSAVTPDMALSLIERAAAEEDASALYIFGQLYDGRSEVDGIEDDIGLTFSDSPAQAAEYYARAATAGSTEANEALLVVCGRLEQMSDTLAQNALEEHCPS
ncbi:hypothetical protein [Devosia sp. Root635]|uniref:hypothetical protein n=1 Tax=Devosia sp. Root635 TaxID=1736575 RepID=UPI0006F3D3D0|nr:hypothetical protein [Devosia sp. Root635]KRA52998.1 hypothetical protein ASD80_14460 [Devosia sp. Root635]